MLSAIERTTFNLSLRIHLALGFVFLFFFVIGLRLWYLQILQGEYFRNRSENNRLRELYIPPPRGGIFARGGEALVRNRPSFNVELVKEDCGDCSETLERLAEITQRDPAELKRVAAESQRKRGRFEPQLILKDIGRDMTARIFARRHALPGLMVRVAPMREYPYGSLAAHVLGYLGEISARQLESPNFSGYRMGDMVGQYGVERVQERVLQGQRGIKGIIVNAMGARIGEAYHEQERAGHNLTLTLDLVTQQAADRALAGLTGAIVALDPETGQILAMSSEPDFDPNVFAAGISPQLWRELTSGPDRALNNRALQGVYHPGSVFKFVMAAAALSEGVITPAEAVNCAGAYGVGSRVFHCHHRHGVVRLHEALRESCNVYFYTVGQRLGIDRIHDYATRFGFGAASGLELAEEQSGLIPSSAWKHANFPPPDNRWYPGETPSVSIGQGAVTVTPLQVARALAALVNGGRLLRPYLVMNAEKQDGTSQYQAESLEQGRLGIDRSVLETVTQALVAVVEEQRGTGGRASLKQELGIVGGGKTGTAQVKRLVGTTTLPQKDSLAWFAGFAPAEAPRIVVVALIERGGHGGAAAAPLVRQVMRAFFTRKLESEEPAAVALLRTPAHARIE